MEFSSVIFGDCSSRESCMVVVLEGDACCRNVGGCSTKMKPMLNYDGSGSSRD
jgi:hypothetical protein